MKKISETNTENIFRNFYGNNTFIEKSAIPTEYGFVSKKGTNYYGYPDFFRDEKNYVIIVEVKKKLCQHDNACLEVKYYMQNNHINKDMVGIAVSGQNSEQVKISYYFKSIAQSDIIELKVGNKFLSLSDIKRVYNKAKQKELNVNLDELTTTLQQLNQKFQDEDIVPVAERSLFFSGLMIALKDSFFARAYQAIEKPESQNISNDEKIIEASILNDEIISAIQRQLQNKISNLSKRYNWGDKFSFIKTIDYPLIKYKKLIKKIHDEIFIPFENEEKLDILGRAYRIFLSRAGTNKAADKNIILTPDHIKSLMVRLSHLTYKDVVLDTCMGTGGFLMEAMEVMTSQIPDDPTEIEKIHRERLIGIERDPVLFALACSNMFLHGDGTSNLIFRSSLPDDNTDNIVNSNFGELFNYIKTLHPTKIIINPPYESNKPIRFVKQALDFLDDNGKLIIIMPSPTLTKNSQSSKSKGKGLTEEILEIAKLDFIIKMPLKLFSEQDRIVNTSIFGFTKTLLGHSKTDEVMFYKLPDDGFVSVQHKGRVDKGCWEETEELICRVIDNQKSIENICEKRLIYDNNMLRCYGVPKINNAIYKMVPIGEIFHFYPGTLASEQCNEWGEYDFITGAKSWKKHDSFTHDTEALIYVTKAAGSLGRVHYVNGKFIASNLCYILLPKSSKYYINMRFYAYYLNHIKQRIVDDLADGTSKLTISSPLLKKYPIEYFPKDIQDNFVSEHLKSLDNIKYSLKKQEQQVSDIFKTRILKESLDK